ncbi:lipase chaperone [Leptospira perolatii]|uniref:Lipase helper protein n=1 Tax=Leptospira perolatii TaxID=2023191 RepID=A0A2M9ZT04_9LEPT|nr:lipase secretion chaperone [Leptospira perolatii]PJZ68790.1 lipase chaperone [Leptospira perolatii]PJZ75145.1 lipase chaperone [Leptospira perolatii]
MWTKIKQLPTLVWILGGVVLLVLLLIFAFSESESNKSGFFGKDEDESYGFSVSQNESGDWIIHPAIQETSRNIYKDGEWLSYEEILKYAASGELDMVSELWALRRRCPQDMGPDQCNEIVKAFLLEQYPGKDGEKLVALFGKYLKYEVTMREMELPGDLKSQETYELVKRKRRNIFSDEEAKLVFGMEEAERDYQFSLSHFLNETKNLSGDKRMQRFDEFRKQVYGNYYNTVTKREPKFNGYETEMFLRENEMEKMAQAQKDSQVRAIREKYFGKEGADRIEQVYRDIEDRKNKETQVMREEQAWLSTNPNASADEKNKAIEAIRSRILGSDEAEEYSRRRSLEEEQKKLNIK